MQSLSRMALCAYVLMITAALCTGTAGAQANPQERIRVDIPAQPLDQAVTELARQAGLTIGGDSALLGDKQAPALEGRYTPRQALDLLLEGTGIRPQVTGEGAVSLVRAQAQDSESPLQLAAIKVEGWRSTTTRGCRPEMISSATKTDSLLADTPISVSVVTADVIADQFATSVGEALRNVAGVEAGPNFANVSVQEEFTIRGFPNTFVNVNGVERRSTGPLSTANIESIEVIKGPSSVLTGTVSPGGMINIQTRRPERQAANEFTGGFSQTTIGGGTQGRGVVDATGPVNQSGSVLYRVIVLADDPELFVLPNRGNTTDAFGFYAQAEVWIHDRVMLLGGLCYDDAEFTARRAGNVSEQNDDELSPRGEVLMELTPDTPLFGSYSRSFQQEGGSDAAGNPFDPTEGKQWEFGLKQELFDGGVLATLTGPSGVATMLESRVRSSHLHDL